MTNTKDLPRVEDLRNYDHAVAGHAGTLCDANGEFFIKPCTQAEIDFYESANRNHPEFAEIMPVFMGTLTLTNPSAGSLGSLNEAVAGIISENGTLETAREQIIASVTEQIANSNSRSTAAGDGVWVPTKGKKIKTDKAVTLENATHGFKRANILDVKLGVRLWADDAPPEKKQRFDKITAETTHGTLGFRIAGMRVFRGASDISELDEQEYKIYDKDYGRTTVNQANIASELRRFIFNEAAGIDDDLGKAVCAAFVDDIARVRKVISRHESRIFSSSLLFVFEGDGKALRQAIEENNSMIDDVNKQTSQCRTAKRMDSGVVLEDECLDDDELEELESALPKIWSLKLIDFAHAAWTPGQGPDENVLIGIRSLERIFKEMAQ